MDGVFPGGSGGHIRKPERPERLFRPMIKVFVIDDAYREEVIGFCRLLAQEGVPSIIVFGADDEVLGELIYMVKMEGTPYLFDVGMFILPRNAVLRLGVEGVVYIAKFVYMAGAARVEAAKVINTLKSFAVRVGASISTLDAIIIAVRAVEEGAVDGAVFKCPLLGHRCPSPICEVMLRAKGTTVCGAVRR